MLERLLLRAETTKRYRRSAVGGYLDGFAKFLAREKLARATVRGYVPVAYHLGRWMQAQGVPIASSTRRCWLPSSATWRSAGAHRLEAHPRIVAIAGARHFLRHLRRLGVTPRPPLADVVEAPFAIARYRVGEVGVHMDGFALFLRRQGYAHETTMMYLSTTRQPPGPLDDGRAHRHGPAR